MKHLFSFFRLNSKKCPYCQFKLKAIPKQAMKCPECNNLILIQKEDKFVKLMTSEEKRDIDAFKKIKISDFSWEGFFELKNEFFRKNNDTKNYNDFLWSLYEILLSNKSKSEDYLSMKTLLELMAEMKKENTTKHKALKKQANTMQLIHDKKLVGSDGFVEVICSDNACEACKKLSKEKIPIEKAIKDMPLPNESCTNQICNCTLISKPITDYMVTGVFSKNLLPEEYKHIQYYLSKWNKYDGDYVKEGENICVFKQVEFSTISPEIYAKAFCDGYLEVLTDASKWDTKESIMQGQDLCAIHKNPDQKKIQELKNKRFENTPIITDDKFTGNTEIKWQSISGKGKLYDEFDVRYSWEKDCIELEFQSIYFTFNYVNKNNYIVFRYFPNEVKIEKGSKISFLFEKDEILVFIVNEKPYEFDKVYIDDKKRRLNEVKVSIKPEELFVFKQSILLNYKIECSISGKVINGTILYSDIQHSIMKLTTEYLELIKKEIEDNTTERVPLQSSSFSSNSDYKFPTSVFLKDYLEKNDGANTQQLESNKAIIIRTLQDFEINIDKIEASVGPTVTLYELSPARGTRLSKIKKLEDDITLALAALGIRINAPLPGKGTVGIEVPNKNPSIVSLKSVIESDEFLNSNHELPIAIGKTIDDKPYVIDLTKMPHILIAGATGQGKSVGLNIIISSLLYKKRPSEVKLILVDPKRVEFAAFNQLKDHFLIKFSKYGKYILTETEEIIETLNALCEEMDKRFKLLQDAKVKNIKEYNDNNTSSSKNHVFMPYIVLVIDEFADLILGGANEVEKPITRLAQLARAVGIHLVIATQRPSVNIITGVIKANFPARIAYRVSSRIDSRTILDSSGAEKLIGRGDMLFSEGANFVRLQCPYVGTEEIEKIVNFIRSQKN
jgi:hypothetical protein